MSYEILFRRMDHPTPKCWVEGIHWQAELYTGDVACPDAIAWVSDWKLAALNPEWYQDGGTFPLAEATLDFVLVRDDMRRRGYATALVKACRARWPGLDLGEAISEGGEKLLAKLEL